LIDAQPYGDEIINAAVDYGSLDHVKEMEEGVARAVDDLKQEDQEYVNGVMDELGNPLFMNRGVPRCGDGLS
jgi:hypothetical protein